MSTACLSGIYSAASSVAATGYSNYDGAGVLSSIFFGVRANTASQTFGRRFSAIDYKIQKQQLHREDFRDLIDLTTSRMDIYHLIGTLLLSFTLAWYTDNELVISDTLPVWYSSIIGISNFGSIGYLLLCVWLAMFAAIASRSVGVRALTSYARISFPTNYQLNQIKAPIFFNSLDFLRRQYRKRTAFDDDLESLGYKAPSVSKEQLGNEEEHPDDSQHFRKVLEISPSFILYDTHARICMTHGTNQLLQALSYYILGYVWPKSMVGALMSFAAVQVLIFLIMYLDIGSVTERWTDVSAWFFFNFLPPVLAAALLLADTLYETGLPRFASLRNLNVLAGLIFVAKGLWLWYLVNLLRSPGKMNSRFKPSRFQNVLEWVGQDVRESEKHIVDELEIACQQLVQHMTLVEEAERESGSVSFELRSTSSEDLLSRASATYESVAKALAPGRMYRKSTWAPASYSTHGSDSADSVESAAAQTESAAWQDSGAQSRHVHPVAEHTLRQAEFTLERFALWERAPQLLAALEALRVSAAQKAFSQSQRKEIDHAYATFQAQCMDLKLGTCSQMDENTPISRAVNAEERYTVRVGESDQSPLISTSGEHLLLEASRVTSYHEVVKVVFPAWKLAVANVHRLSRLQSYRPVDGGRDPVRWENGPSTILKNTKDETPAKMVRWFTTMMILWWITAGAYQSFTVIIGGRNKLWNDLIGMDTNINVSFIEIEWPAPSILFEVGSLHCDASHTWVSNKFAAYSMRNANNLSTLMRIRNESIDGVICGPRGCDALSRSISDSWKFTSLSLRGHVHKNGTLPLPSSWRLVSGAWTDCLGGEKNRCTTARLAGWDGGSIVVASLTQEAASGIWVVTTEFEANPAKGLCAGAYFSRTSTCAQHGHLKYNGVTAIQMGAGSQSLLVLSDDGVLDAWDLVRGVVVKRWALDQAYSAMCYGGDRLMLTREGPLGPEMVAVAVPQEVSVLFMQKPSAIKQGTRFEPRISAGSSSDRRVLHRRRKLRGSRAAERYRRPSEIQLLTAGA